MTPPLMRPGSVTTPGTFAIGVLLFSSGKPIITITAKSAIAEHARRGRRAGTARSRGNCLVWNAVGSARSVAGDVRRRRTWHARRRKRRPGAAGQMVWGHGTPETEDPGLYLRLPLPVL